MSMYDSPFRRYLRDHPAMKQILDMQARRMAEDIWPVITGDVLEAAFEVVPDYEGDDDGPERSSLATLVERLEAAWDEDSADGEGATDHAADHARATGPTAGRRAPVLALPEKCDDAVRSEAQPDLLPEVRFHPAASREAERRRALAALAADGGEVRGIGGGDDR